MNGQDFHVLLRDSNGAVRAISAPLDYVQAGRLSQAVAPFARPDIVPSRRSLRASITQANISGYVAGPGGVSIPLYAIAPPIAEVKLPLPPPEKKAKHWMDTMLAFFLGTLGINKS